MTVGHAPGLALGHFICVVCVRTSVCVRAHMHVTAARLDPLTSRHSGSVPNGTNRHVTETPMLHIQASGTNTSLDLL